MHVPNKMSLYNTHTQRVKECLGTGFIHLLILHNNRHSLEMQRETERASQRERQRERLDACELFSRQHFTFFKFNNFQKKQTSNSTPVTQYCTGLMTNMLKV